MSRQKGCCDNEGTGESMDRAGCAQAPGARLEVSRQEAGQSVETFQKLSPESWGPVRFRVLSHAMLRPRPGPLENSMCPRVSCSHSPRRPPVHPLPQ